MENQNPKKESTEKGRKLRVLAVGDIHGDRELAKRLAEKADKQKVDLVVMCGDLVSKESEIRGLLGDFKQKVLIVPGNHETPATINFLAEIYKGRVINLHKGFYKKYGVGFFGCGSDNVGLFRLTNAELADYLRLAGGQVSDCEKRVMITHVHPSNTKMERLSRFVAGNAGVRRAVEELNPDILLCSHVHEAEGIEEMVGKTKVINVGREGKIFEI